jgi:hypothetical protein
MKKEFDVGRLEGSLLKTIEQIPALAGKLVSENNRILIDTDGVGVSLVFEVADKKAPPSDDTVFPIKGHQFVAQPPDTHHTSMSEWPLLIIKVTTFSDGIHCIGVRHNHALADAASFLAFLTAWNKNLHGASDFVPEFSRDSILALASGSGERPSEKSGITYNDAGLVAKPLVFFETDYATFGMSAAEYEHLQMHAKQQEVDKISVNDLLNAMVFKSYGQSSKQAGTELAIANLTFDIRRVKNSGLPLNIFGNCVLLRTLALSFDELRSESVLRLAKRFKQLCEPDLESVAQDIAFYQAQYESGQYSRHGVFTSFPPIIANGGIYINNTIQKGSLLNFGGQNIGGGLLIQQPFGLRMALFVSSIHGGVYVRLTLEKEQIDLFQEHWSTLFKQVLQNGLSSTGR